MLDCLYIFVLAHIRVPDGIMEDFVFGFISFPGIQVCTTNVPFQDEMELFLAKIIDLMKEENLFATQGGPIILAQVENQYGNVEWAYGVRGEQYVKWTAPIALNFNISAPWVMSSQEDAPDPIVYPKFMHITHMVLKGNKSQKNFPTSANETLVLKNKIRVRKCVLLLPYVDNSTSYYLKSRIAL